MSTSKRPGVKKIVVFAYCGTSSNPFETCPRLEMFLLMGTFSCVPKYFFLEKYGAGSLAGSSKKCGGGCQRISKVAAFHA